MAVYVVILLVFLLQVEAQQSRRSNISLGSSLTPNTLNQSSWLSPSGLFAFGFFPQTNASAVGIFIADTLVWTANANNPTVASATALSLTLEGRLVLQQRAGQEIDLFAPGEPISSASMLDNGNFILYDSNSRIIWQSFDSPTNTLLPGQRLGPNQELVSRASETDHSRGIFKLSMQEDGNLVQYADTVGTPNRASYSYYSTGTQGSGNNVSLNLANDGRLYLLNGTSFLQNITTGGFPTQRNIYAVRIDVDGIFSLYSVSLDREASWISQWSSTDDECVPIGRCGINSFCVNMDREVTCRCLPSFKNVQPGNWSAGCTLVWTANANNPTVASASALRFTLDGRLVLQQRRGQDIDLVSPGGPISSASMLDNGNFVLYDSNSRIIWQSFDSPTNTLLSGQRLGPNKELVSSASETDHSRGIFRLKMQSDGNLVQYPVGTPDSAPYSYYATGTDGRGNNISLNLANDGRLYLLNGSSFLQNITTGGLPTQRIIYATRIDVDGIFRLYSVDREESWISRWSSTDDECVPKGRCGINSFCVNMDREVTCRCLPGFTNVQSGNSSAGCTRDFVVEGCDGNEMRQVENVVWEDNSYGERNAVTREICEQACLDDCNCEAAFFKDGRCSKQRLPLRFGRRQLSDTNIALVKVSTTTEEPNRHVEIKKEVRLDVFIVSISLAVASLLVVSISVIYVHRKQRTYKKIIDDSGLEAEDVALRAFTYSDIVEATNGFKEELGKGASGTVFKGTLRSSEKAVAVKRLENEVTQGDKEFQTEMKTIGRTYHRNLVRLLGYCLNGPNKLLVFEYMSNGSLTDILFKSDNRPSWEERTKLARDIARGILYLHEECEVQIIHCDIKPQNILIDENGCAKISDFGLAKLLKQDQTNTYTGIRGTRGYVAPEWHQKQPVTVKADIYSYGIVLLEIICCRRSVDSTLSFGEAILEEWIYDCYASRDIGKLVGDEEVEKRKLERMVKVGLWCIQEDPSFRPSMKKVLLMLEGTVDIPEPPSPKSFLSSTTT